MASHIDIVPIGYDTTTGAHRPRGLSAKISARTAAVYIEIPALSRA